MTRCSPTKRWSAEFSHRLLAWQRKHGRHDLPWQIDRSAYRVWVSEIMLQQTRVETVKPYYARFLQRFPTVDHLADATEDEVLALWSGLGYYRRARMLLQAARICQTEHDGDVPADFETLSTLPGIGRSTAGAILALSDNAPLPILDANCKRVYARCLAVSERPGTTAFDKQLWAIAKQVTPPEKAGAFAQAMMDLGAQICLPKPTCERCPVSDLCLAHERGEQLAFPLPRKRKPKPLRKRVFMVFLRDQAVWLEKRSAHGIWPGLWSFPEFDDEEQASVVLADNDFERLTPIRHGFTHFMLEAEPWLIRTKEASLPSICDVDAGAWCSPTEQRKLGIPAPIRKLLETL